VAPGTAAPNLRGDTVLLIHLYGFLEGDFLGRVVVVDQAQSVGAVADQLQAWGLDLYPRRISEPTVTNEEGAVLNLASSLSEAGLSGGDIFHVGGGPE
jgi:hypothetical protein